MSNATKRLVHKIWGKLGAINVGHSLGLDISRHPLYRDYSIHKFEVAVKHSDVLVLIKARRLFIDQMRNEGWNLSGNTPTYLEKPQGHDRTAFIYVFPLNPPQDRVTTPQFLCISPEIR